MKPYSGIGNIFCFSTLAFVLGILSKEVALVSTLHIFLLS